MGTARNAFNLGKKLFHLLFQEQGKIDSASIFFQILLEIASTSILFFASAFASASRRISKIASASTRKVPLLLPLLLPLPKHCLCGFIHSYEMSWDHYKKSDFNRICFTCYKMKKRCFVCWNMETDTIYPFSFQPCN